MAATPTPGVKVELMDGVHTLRFTNRALVELEDETGLTFQELSGRLQLGSLKTISAMVWAGLLHEDPTLAVDDAVDLVDLTRVQELSEAIGEAMAAALGVEDEEEDEGDPPAPETDQG